MNQTFNFQEALYYIQADMPVYIIINGTKRKYFMNEEGHIMCTPNNKEHLTYRVATFHIDAVMSNDWRLCDEAD